MTNTKTTNPPGITNQGDFTPKATEYEYQGLLYGLYDMWLASNGITYLVPYHGGPLQANTLVERGFSEKVGDNRGKDGKVEPRRC